MWRGTSPNLLTDQIDISGSKSWEDGGSERPVKEQDHAMDDLRYFVMYCEQEEKPGGFCAARVERTRR